MMVCSVAWDVLGTAIDTNIPLMSAGLDSIATTDFTQTLSAHGEMELSPTMLFDHPTIDSIATLLSSSVNRAQKFSDLETRKYALEFSSLPTSERQC